MSSQIISASTGSKYFFDIRVPFDILDTRSQQLFVEGIRGVSSMCATLVNLYCTYNVPVWHPLVTCQCRVTFSSASSPPSLWAFLRVSLVISERGKSLAFWVTPLSPAQSGVLMGMLNDWPPALFELKHMSFSYHSTLWPLLSYWTSEVFEWDVIFHTSLAEWLGNFEKAILLSLVVGFSSFCVCSSESQSPWGNTFQRHWWKKHQRILWDLLTECA